MLQFILIVLFEAIGSDLYLAGYKRLGNICIFISIALVVWMIARVIFLIKGRKSPDESFRQKNQK